MGRGVEAVGDISMVTLDLPCTETLPPGTCTDCVEIDLCIQIWNGRVRPSISSVCVCLIREEMLEVVIKHLG